MLAETVFWSPTDKHFSNKLLLYKDIDDADVSSSVSCMIALVHDAFPDFTHGHLLNILSRGMLSIEIDSEDVDAILDAEYMLDAFDDVEQEKLAKEINTAKSEKDAKDTYRAELFKMKDC